MNEQLSGGSSGIGWTQPQRRAIVVVLMGVLLYGTVRYFRNPLYVANPQPVASERQTELMDRIDPNTADWQTFAALPAIGEKRAREIVAYRDRVRVGKPDAVVFERAEDLARVKGIGASIVATLKPYLVFPSVDGTTQPSNN